MNRDNVEDYTGRKLMYGIVFISALYVVILYSELQLYVWLPILLFGSGIFVYLIVRREDRKLTNTIMGYNRNPVNRPFFLFGSSEYERYRIDDNPVSLVVVDSYYNKLMDLERKQRSNSKCKNCGTEFESDPLDSDTFYVVEYRKLYRIFGIPIRDKVLDWDTYCYEHRPDNFQHESHSS